jgi:hypothetical protein
MRTLHNDVFKNTDLMDAMMIVGNHNRRDFKNELIHKRHQQTLFFQFKIYHPNHYILYYYLPLDNQNISNCEKHLFYGNLSHYSNWILSTYIYYMSVINWSYDSLIVEIICHLMSFVVEAKSRLW